MPVGYRRSRPLSRRRTTTPSDRRGQHCVEESKRKAAEARAAGNPVRERVRAIAKKQQLLGEATDGVGAALGRMQEADGARDAALDRAARDRQEMLDGTTYYHSVAKD